MLFRSIRGKVTNIPEFLFGDVVKISSTSGEEIMDSTETFRGPFSAVEIRDHYRIVMTPSGIPIWHFVSLVELLSVTLDVING